MLAAATGIRSLEEVDIDCWYPSDIAEYWAADLEPALVLNRQRRLHGYLFEAIEQGENDLTRKERFWLAVHVVEMAVLYSFAGRNEWRLQMLIKETAGAICNWERSSIPMTSTEAKQTSLRSFTDYFKHFDNYFFVFPHSDVFPSN